MTGTARCTCGARVKQSYATVKEGKYTRFVPEQVLCPSCQPVERCRIRSIDVSIDEMRVIDEAVDMLSWEQHTTLRPNPFVDEVAKKYGRMRRDWEKEIERCRV